MRIQAYNYEGKLVLAKEFQKPSGESFEIEGAKGVYLIIVEANKEKILEQKILMY